MPPGPVNDKMLPPSAKAVGTLEAVPKLGARTSMVITGIVLLGWAVGSPGLTPLNPISCLCLFAFALALELKKSSGSASKPVGDLLCCCVAFISLIKLKDVVLGVESSFDLWLFHPGDNRMSPSTAFCTLLLSSAMLCTRYEKPSERFSQSLALVAHLLSMLAITGYIFGVRSLTGFAFYKPMSIQSAAVCALLSLGVLFLYPAEGSISRLVSSGAGGAMLRSLLPFVLGAPIVIGLLILIGKRLDFYGSESAFSIFVILIALAFCVILWSNAGALDRKEALHNEAHMALQKAGEELESLVQERTATASVAVTEIGRGVDVLTSAAQEILAATQQLTATASSTSSELFQTATTISQVRQTAEVSSERAHKVARSSIDAAYVTQEGRHATEQMQAGVQRISERMASIATTVIRLSEQSQSIGSIITAVEQISQQSNLLAVNAAVEAAHAGAVGKGFAVVAQEVKYLAERSRSATAEVRAILREIQKAIQSAVLAIEEGTKVVEQGLEQSRRASGSIQLLAESMVDAADASAQIAASCREQLVGMDQIVSAMTGIRNGAIENVDSAKHIEAAVRDLGQLAEKLRQVSTRK